MTGLEVKLPARAGVEYHVSGSWALSEKGTFDSRDVIDEFSEESGEILAGNWVLTGYFDAGDCDSVLGLEPLDRAWTSQTELWGATWSVRGGVYTFEDASLGRRPASIMCQSDDEGRSLLLYRFLLDQPETLGQDEVMTGLSQAVVLEQAWLAYRELRTRDVQPTRRAEVRNRGKVSAQRVLELETTKLAVDLPDDGYIWLVHKGDGSDILDRMAPSLPDLSLEVVGVDGLSCTELFAALAKGETLPQKPRNIPAGWTAGPAVSLDGKPLVTVCHEASYGALLAGLIQDGAAFDLTPLHAVLEALLRAPKR
jgi:hypothetical protein